jgi:hypothetical protein
MLELRVVVLAVRHWVEAIRVRVVLIVTDKEGWTRSLCVVDMTEILRFCHGMGVTIRAKHTAGKLSVVNALIGSIQPEPEYCLDPKVRVHGSECKQKSNNRVGGDCVVSMGGMMSSKCWFISTMCICANFMAHTPPNTGLKELWVTSGVLCFASACRACNEALVHSPHSQYCTSSLDLYSL